MYSKLFSKQFLFISALTILTLLFGFFRISSKSYSFDETFTLYVSRELPYLFHTVLYTEANMWLHLFIIHFWQKISTVEWFIRGFSVFSAALSVPVFYFLSKKLFNNKVATISTLLMPFNLLFVLNAQTARSYSLLLLFTLLASLYFIKSEKKPTKKNHFLFIVFSSLSIYSHIYASFLVLGQFLYYLFSKNKNRLKYIVLWGLGISLLLLPLLLTPSFYGSQINWLSAPTITGLVGAFSLFAGDFLPLFVIFSIIYFYYGFLLIRQQLWKQPSHVYIILLLTLTILTPFLISTFLKPIYRTVYLFLVLPYFLLITGYALSQIKQKVILFIILGILLTFSSFRLYGWYFKIPNIGIVVNNNVQDWNDITAYIVKNSQPGDAVIFFPYKNYLSFETYQRINHSNTSISLPIIETSSKYYHLGGGTKVQPFPDEKKMNELSSHFNRVWWVELIDPNDALNVKQKNKYLSLLHKNYDYVGTTSFFQVKTHLFVKKTTLRINL